MLRELFGAGGPPARVLFRVDAGRIPGLSFGHLERCAVLSRALRREYATDCTFLMRPIPDGVERARALGEAVEIMAPDGQARAGAHALVIDLPYDPEPELLAQAGALGWTVIVLDDTGRDLCACDVALNSSVLARPDMYPRARKVLAGPRHLILDERFLAARHLGSGRTPPTVLLSFGGSDPTGLTVRALEAVAGLDAPFAGQVVLGPGFSGREHARQAARPLEGRRWDVLDCPPDMLSLFTGCDLAVCAGGRTMYELNALGTPMLAVASSEPEARAVEAFARLGLLRGAMSNWDARRFAELLGEALHGLNAENTGKGRTT